MSDFDELSKELLKGHNGKKVNKIVNSAEGKRIGKIVDGEALKKAAKSGDEKTLSNIMSQVLSTEDGKKLVSRIGESFGNKQ